MPKQNLYVLHYGNQIVLNSHSPQPPPPATLKSVPGCFSKTALHKMLPYADIPSCLLTCRPLPHHIQLLLPQVLVQCVGAPGRQPPEPRGQVFAAGALQKIRIRDFHEIRRPPVQVVRRDEVIALNRFHVPHAGTDSAPIQLLRPPAALHPYTPKPNDSTATPRNPQPRRAACATTASAPRAARRVNLPAPWSAGLNHPAGLMFGPAPQRKERRLPAGGLPALPTSRGSPSRNPAGVPPALRRQYGVHRRALRLAPKLIW